MAGSGGFRTAQAEPCHIWRIEVKRSQQYARTLAKLATVIETPIPRGGELAGRLRAIRAYAGIGQDELASHLNISERTLSRLENGAAQSDDVLTAARACHVPRAFAEAGFAPLDREITDVERRLYELEATVRSLADERQTLLAELGERVGQMVAQALDSGQLPTSEEDAASATTPAGDESPPSSR